MKTRFDDACNSLSYPLYRFVFTIPDEIKEVAQEIRLRVNKAISVTTPKNTYYINLSGNCTSTINDNSVIVSRQDIAETFKNICNHSVYSKQNEIKNGFVTMRGGHRAGISGTAVYINNEVTNIRDITSINIRIASEKIGISNNILDITGDDFNGILLCGSPCSGKTTIIRDIARKLSLNGNNVAVIDERGEIASVVSGTAQNNIGMCDILDGYSKFDGINQAIRCLSPDYVICDEIGDNNGLRAIELGLNNGVKFVATLHCANIDELKRRQNIVNLINKGFDRIVFLKSRKFVGEIAEIYNGNLELIYA